MKKAFVTLLVACACSLICEACPTGLDKLGQLQPVVRSEGQGFVWEQLQNGVQFRINEMVKNVVFYEPATVRVTATLGESYATHPSIVVVTNFIPIELGVNETDDELVVFSPKLRVVVMKKSGAVAFYGRDGKLFTRERTDGPISLKKTNISGAPTYEAAVTFTMTPDESLYGLGQYTEPYMDYRGKKVKLVQSNIGIVVPVLVSTRRYGIMWDIYSKAFFSDDANGATFQAESAPAGMDYYFFAGDTLDEVIAGYRRLTGAAPMFPKAAFGLFMSKERYKTQDRVIEVAMTFRRVGFPLDYIVQDWQYWGGERDGTWSGMIWDKERYPDPAAMTRMLHDMQVRLMISVWPSIGNDTELAKELDAKGLRFRPLHWISRRARIYDAYSPEARAIYFKHLKRGLLDVGVDAIWMDGTEVEVSTACHSQDEVERDIKRLGTNAMGDFTRYLNTYSLMATKGLYEEYRKVSNKRLVCLTRSAWAGQQRYAAIPWSGDTTASWTTLRNQISGGINVAMAGLPYWTQDTGGFFVHYTGGENNPEYRELFARWHQFAIFNPIYRIHGTQIEREPYIFKAIDRQIYKSLLVAAHLRYRLLPYIYALGWQTTANGYTMMRGLAMDFPDDLKVRKIDDAFMFGPAFLVHPVTRAIYYPSDPPARTISADVLRTPDDMPGLAVQYFEGINFEKPAGKTVDTKFEHHWPGAPLAEPPPGLKSCENFSARWEGFFVVPEDGEHELGVEYDDGCRLYLDGKLIVDDWNFGPKRYKGGRAELKKGQKLPIKVEFYQGTLDRFFRLCLRTPSEIKAIADAKREINDIVETYLPAGADWYDFWTNKRYKGGQRVKRACPMDEFPIYVRAGSIVPFGPIIQYATEMPDGPYEIRIYPGANARFTIYEDDNETYDYENGRYAMFDLSWDDAKRTLGIGPRKGSFPGMITRRTLQIVVVAPGENAGVYRTPSDPKTIEYTGQPIEVTFKESAAGKSATATQPPLRNSASAAVLNAAQSAE